MLARLLRGKDMSDYKYYRWDGTQRIFEIQPEELFDELSNEVLSYGDLRWALQRLMQRGLTNRFGQRLEGMRELLKRLQKERQRQLDKYNLGSILDDIKERLKSIVEKERRGLERRQKEPPSPSGESPLEGQEQEKLSKMLEDMIAQKRSFLDSLPRDPGGMIKGLNDYDFMDEEARREFQELMEMLKQRMLESFFKDLSQRLKGMTPQEMDYLRQMAQSLNRMLEERMRGGTPDFQGFMEQYGHLFGPNPPDNLDDFIEQLQDQIAQMQSLMDSLPEELRQSLRDLLDSPLLDQAMRDELAQLAANLEYLYPMEELRQAYPFVGEDPISLTEAMRLMEKLQNIEELKKQLEAVQGTPDLEGIDAEKLKEVLGEEAGESLEYLKQLAKILEDAGYIRRRGNRFEISPKGIRRIGQRALKEIFSRLQKERLGRHDTSLKGVGVENADDTKKYEFGDNFSLHLPQSLLNSVKRRGAKVPIRMRPEDFEVFRTDLQTQCSTVLLLDQSRSMDLNGYFPTAKKVALALHSLIRTQFPRDQLHVIGFSDYARELKGENLPEVSCSEYMPGTNMHHALMLSRRILTKNRGQNKQIIMVTDGEPTAHLEGGRSSFFYPPSQKTIQATLREVKRCTQASITINVFMLDSSYYLVNFIDQLVRINRGRAFFTTPEKLGQYILRDYMSGRRRRVD